MFRVHISVFLFPAFKEINSMSPHLTSLASVQKEFPSDFKVESDTGGLCVADVHSVGCSVHSFRLSVLDGSARKKKSRIGDFVLFGLKGRQKCDSRE